MALTGLTEWTVRTDGDDLNGGAFNQHRTNGGVSAFAGLGTDRSLAATPFVTFDGSTITASNGGAGATITLSGYTVSTADLGNHLKIASGTNFVAGTYEIISVNVGSNTWTLDSNCTSGAGSGLVGRMGGGRATIASAVAVAVDGSAIHIKSGTYTLTSAIAWSSKGLNFIGYQTNHYDYGAQPLITTATNSTKLFAPTSGFSLNYSFHCLSFSNTAVTRTCAISCGQGNFVFSNCIWDGFTIGGLDPTSVSGADSIFYYNCEIKNSTATGASTGNVVVWPNNANCVAASFVNCFIHDGAGYGIYCKASLGAVVFHNTVISNNASDGIIWNQSPMRASISNCTIANNGANGVNLGSVNTPILVFSDNIIYGNTSTGVTYTYTASGGSAFLLLVNRNNAYGGNGTNRASFLSAGTNAITLTSDPFTNSASRDYTLNSSAGGGALLKSIGANFLNLTNYKDIGALQSAAAAPAVGTINIQVADLLVAR